jgi:hypothetical protein
MIQNVDKFIMEDIDLLYKETYGPNRLEEAARKLINISDKNLTMKLIRIFNPQATEID